ncbi:MAG TPA: RagB/SusD family nutrient uptake outer membrane protein, partial [Flavitalea sp.]|nr:RagB/SusD family nutrient uptake outer membrane protein [Flavitalea sp.]
MKTLIEIMPKCAHSILTLLLILLSVSCSKNFLDLKNTNDLTSDNFFKTPRDFEYAINAVYRSAEGVRDDDRQHINVQQARGGESDLVSVHNQEFFNYTNDVTNALSGGLYANLYHLIYRANTVLYEMDVNKDVQWDNERQKELISAQAYFFRGLGYFYLAHSFGEVAIVTTPAFT